MANRTVGTDRLLQIQLGDTQIWLDNGQYLGQIYKHELLGRLTTGLVDQGGPTTPLFEGIAQDDALSTASPAEVLHILRKGAFKAVVKSTDAAAVAERAFRIKGSGTSDGLVAADRGKAVFVQDSLTLTVQPTAGMPKAGYIAKLVSYGTAGAGEAVVVLDADWARAGLDESDLDPEAEARIQSVDFDGIDIGARMVLTERFEKRPFLAADVTIFTDSSGGSTATPNTIAAITTGGAAADEAPTENAIAKIALKINNMLLANTNFEVAGTNMTSALVTFNVARGGIRLTTAGATNDQCILQPRQTNSADSRWAAGYLSDLKPVWKTSFRVGSVTGISFKAALALTNAHNLTTDDDQVGVWWSSATGGNILVVTSIAGVDATIDTGVAAAAGTEYRVVIALGADRIARVFINDTLVGTTGALTTAKTFKPYVSIQDLSAGTAHTLDVRFETGAQAIAA